MGVKLAHALLPTLDPLSGGGGAPSPDEPPVEPVFTRPRVEAGLLPGAPISPCVSHASPCISRCVEAGLLPGELHHLSITLTLTLSLTLALTLTLT